MSRRFAKSAGSTRDTVSVIKLDKSGGCVDRDSEYLQQFRQAQIREYFFGDTKNPLSPHTQQMDFSEVAIYRFAECESWPIHSRIILLTVKAAAGMLASFLPGGEEDSLAKDAIYERVQPSSTMQSCILAIVQAEPHDTPESIRDASVIGFVYVADVDEKKKKMRILAPLSGRVPRKAMVWGIWPESAGDLVG